MNKTSLEELLREKIPLAKAMDVRVTEADGETIELRCLLEPNHNHLGTAFGGSLSTLMILAAYCRLFYLMGGQGHVLLKSSEMKFLKPVEEDLCAICKAPSEKDSADFLKIYNKKGKARLFLTSEVILEDGSVAARANCEFVGQQ